MFKRFNFNLIARISFLILSLVLFSSAYAEISVKDDSGNIITLKRPAERIISLAPHATESLFAAGAGDKIIGAVSYSDYPESAKSIPRVGGYPSLDIEKIVTLKPDLIVAWGTGNNQKQVMKLASLGFNVFISEPKLPQDIAKTIKRFGKLAGTSSTANKISVEFMQHYHSLLDHFSKKKKIKVFYQFWNKPIMTINRNHLISNVINLCGGINVFSDLHSLTPKVSIEAVLATNTDVIIAGGKGDKKEKWISEWEVWTQLAAVKNKQIYFIDPDLLNRAGPRILDGADKLCALLDKARKSD